MHACLAVQYVSIARKLRREQLGGSNVFLHAIILECSEKIRSDANAKGGI